MERVTALGWADELSKMRYPDDFKYEPDIERFCQKEITGRGNFFQSTQCYILSQAFIVLLQVDEFINTYMVDAKAKRLQKERDALLLERLPILRNVYNICVETYPVNSIIPRASDVFLDPVVQDLFFRPPLSTTFTEKDLETVGTFFPDIVLRWRNKTEEKLLNLSPNQNISESLLRLTSAGHDYFFLPILYQWPFDISSSSYTQMCHLRGIWVHEDQVAIRDFLGGSYRNAGKIINFDAQKIACLSEAIKLCGLDPKSVTREDMDKQNPIFECLACNDLRKGRCTLSWLGLVLFIHFSR